jgi:phosphatidate cytidylyltransferase
MSAAERWADLRPRVLSAAVMVVVGGLAIALGGSVFLLVVLFCVTVMMWELSRLTAPHPKPFLDYGLGVLAGLCVFLWTSGLVPPLGWGLLGLPALALIVTPRRDRLAIGLFALGLMIATAGFLNLRTTGIPAVLWLLFVVTASDMAGYFAGRLIGGPKFWPAISPKKTWSGTIAGWIAAALVGLVFGIFTDVPPVLLWLSPVVAVAGQFGDIAKSWVKRRAGVKDSSALIPGHGGLLDRFDALLGAMLAVQILILALGGLG